jgi:hypothetical protein
MANLIKLKRSSTSGNNPTTSNLELGELAINTYDGNLFFKKDSGTASIVAVTTLDGAQTLTNKTLASPVITGTLTAGGGVGTNGQILISTGTGVQWTSGGGATGVQGASGVLGASGVQGASGATGTAGTNGATGVSGASGAQGIQGASGATGAQGIQGASGATGVFGATGVQGASGATGLSGATGVQGASGSTGLTGATGPASVVSSLNWVQSLGASGFSGATGATGAVFTSASITGLGGPIEVTVYGDANPLVAGGWGTLQIYRGTTPLGTPINFEGSSANENNPYALHVIDNPGAGTFTYTLRLITNAGGGVQFGETGTCTWTVKELANVVGASGATGTAGTNGATGTAGTNGATGITGASGVQGASGSTGLSGATGPSTAINATNDTSTTVLYPVFVGAAGSNQTPKVTTTKLAWNASTGSLTITGSLFATTKSFRIAHPTKEGMVLTYGSLEGPENGVYVRGRLTDSNEIILPDYWIKLVDLDSISVNLTPIGAHQKLYVQEISIDKITIGNDNLFGKAIDCYFTVYAERNDIDKLEVEV